MHGLRQLGATIKEDAGFLMCHAKKLVGCKINLDFPSVGATENIMLAAIFAEGETVICNAAKEPEIVDLQNFLNGMGAKVYGAGNDEIVIHGVKSLHSVEHTVIPDRIVAGTLLVAAAITKGEIILSNVVTAHLYPITSKLSETGCIIQECGDAIHLKSIEKIKAIRKIQTYPHPGFPTDMQSQFMALLSIANGTSTFQETIFESRTKHISELIRMGADIISSSDGMTSIINGVKKLQGCDVVAKDLRGGASLILAGLCAEGSTRITGIEHVERGYECIEDTLHSLGADIMLKTSFCMK